jgi:hypothetical protein
VRAEKDGSSFGELAVDGGGIPVTAVDINLVLVGGQDLYTLGGKGGGIDKDTATVVVRARIFRGASIITKCIPANSQGHSPGSVLGVVLETPEGAPAARPRKEGQLPATDNLHGGVIAADLELAPGGAVVASGAEAEVGATSADKVGDAAVAVTVEDAAVAQVAAAGEDEEGAGLGPWLFEEDSLSDGCDGIVWRQEAAQGGEGMSHRLGGRAGAWDSSVGGHGGESEGLSYLCRRGH